MKLHYLLAILLIAFSGLALGSDAYNGYSGDEDEREEAFIRVSSKKRTPSKSPLTPQRRVNSIEDHVRKHNIPDKVTKKKSMEQLTLSDE